MLLRLMQPADLATLWIYLSYSREVLDQLIFIVFYYSTAIRNNRSVVRSTLDIPDALHRTRVGAVVLSMLDDR
ncbi:hypothetical protein GJV44_00672 [Candidatus Vallotia cooleyia]|nr:hypothetical protein GJV44_00672 [Candidatus Vallotia cooleyia]